MKADFAPLLRALDDMLAIHREMAALGQEKLGVIIAGDTDRLSVLVQREMRLMQQSGAAEKARAAAANTLAGQLGISQQPPSVSALAAAAPNPAEREKLETLARELGALLGEQRELGRRAKELLETHIAHTDMMLNLIVGPEDPLNNIYGAQGLDDKTRRQTPGLFDRQA